MTARIASALALVAIASAKKYNTDAKRMPDAGILNVHVIAHTHDDVGWLKTVDEYYTGLNNSIQHAGVENILDSVIASLVKNPDRKFIYVEQAFFQRWYVTQDAATQALVKKLVATGQLEHVNSGTTMHDEAAPTFIEMADNMALGHRAVLRQFGPEANPTVAWSIDPFGHSSTNVALFASPLAGMNSFFFSRADWEDLQTRQRTKSLEWIHTPSDSLGPFASSFSSVMNSGQHLYFPLPGLCWDIVNCNDQAWQDNPALTNYNVPAMVANVVAQIKEQAGRYVGDVYLTQGFDFNFEYAEEWFKGIDKMIHYMNMNTTVHGMNLFYSTPSIYANTKLDYPYAWPTKGQDDGMPYGDDRHNYWSGYFTSRPALKGYVRETSALFQGVKQIQAWTAPASALPVSAAPGGDLGVFNPLTRLDEALAISTHHDGVSGTSMQHVANDYAMRLAWGRADASSFMGPALAALTKAPAGASFLLCDLANVTICPPLESTAATVLVAIYNSQGATIASSPVRIPVVLPTGTTWKVTDASSGAAIVSQTIPASPSDNALRTGYYNVPLPGGVPMGWLVWQANLPAAGVATYAISPVGAGTLGAAVASEVLAVASPAGADVTITNGIVTLTFDASTGLLSNLANSAAGVNSPLVQEWWWYNSSSGNSRDSQQASGAYIFRPNSSTVYPVRDAAVGVTVTTGPVLNEVVQSFSPWLSQSVRLWAGVQSVDFEWTIGPVPFADGLGREVITRYSIPGLATAGTCKTDSSGRDMLTRIRNFRPSWNITVFEPVAANYYPVSGAIETVAAGGAANALTLSVVVDRTEAGGSIVDGSIELMAHRRLQVDDQRGVNEPLNETGLTGNGLVIRGLHRLNLLPANAGAAVARRTAMQDVALARPFIALAPLAPGAPAPTTLTRFSGLSAPLPSNVALMSVQAYGPLNATTNTLLLRLAHLYQVGEDASASSNVTVSLSTLFSSFRVLSASELTITGNQPLSNVRSTTFRRQGDDAAHPLMSPPMEWAQSTLTSADLSVTMTPLSIRTFLLSTQTVTGSVAAAAQEAAAAAPPPTAEETEWLRFLLGQL